jgi:hypothetical protein
MTVKDRLDKHDREIAAIRKLILTGMKMINQLAASQKETDRQLKETDRQLKETDRQLQAFIQSIRRGSNGHTKRSLPRN